MATKKSSKAEQTLRLVARLGMARPKDAAPFGIEPFHFRRLLHQGKLSQVARGIYRLAQDEPSSHPHHRLAEAAKRVPHAVVCLQSALHFHRLAKQAPPEVWLAIDRKARRPSVEGMAIRFVRFSGAALRQGFEEHSVEGLPVRVTTCTKTVADCFKYRNKIGIDVALQALRECIRQKRCPKDELVKCAKLCRMTGVMRPYLEVLA
jgi:predicted transcriptional regulator of viral defense system